MNHPAFVQYRTPRDVKNVRPVSACPACGTLDIGGKTKCDTSKPNPIKRQGWIALDMTKNN